MGAPESAIAAALCGPFPIEEMIRQAREAAALGIPGAGREHFRLLGFRRAEEQKTAWDKLTIEQRARIAAAVGSHALARMRWREIPQAERQAIKAICWRQAQALLGVYRIGVFFA